MRLVLLLLISAAIVAAAMWLPRATWRTPQPEVTNYAYKCIVDRVSQPGFDDAQLTEKQRRVYALAIQRYRKE